MKDKRNYSMPRIWLSALLFIKDTVRKILREGAFLRIMACPTNQNQGHSPDKHIRAA
jgi:hypothetical protein